MLCIPFSVLPFLYIILCSRCDLIDRLNNDLLEMTYHKITQDQCDHCQQQYIPDQESDTVA